jgi:virginiamycin B lyase
MPGKGASSVAAALTVAVCVLILAPAASGFIYWGNAQSQSLGRAENDGSGVNSSFIATGPQPAAVAVDSAHIYWANQNGSSIGRANIDGTGVDNSFITGIVEPSGVAVNGSSVYWSTLGGTIGKADLSGANVKPKFLSGLVEPCGVALDSGHVYWVEIDSGTPAYVSRVGLDGSNLQLGYVTIPGSSFPCGVAVNSANIFWSEPGFFCCGTRIGRASINGSGADPSFIGGASAPCGVALDTSSHLYWANLEAGTIGRANTDGTAVDQSFVATGTSAVCGVAVDSGSSPPPPAQPDTAPPQTKISSGPGKALAKGIAKFRFRSSEAGSTFLCKLDAKKARRCSAPKRYRGLRPGKHVFRVWAVDAAGNKDPSPAKRRFRVPCACA